ncbi:MAG: hypothetical protein LH478_13545 [Chitinophagaceae bacterium]|nr:hypothetical protein [Chitinophagaceae bacterium]
MKKFFASILAVLYFTASSGTVLNLHYCMGKLSSVEVDNLSVKSCMCGPQEPKSACCGDEIKVLKVSNVHQASVGDFSMDVQTTALPTAVSLMDVSKLTGEQISKPYAHAPPDIPVPSANILHCVFLI